VDRLEVVHVLVDEFDYGNLCRVAVSFVTNKPYSEDVAQSSYNQIWILANRRLESDCKLLYGVVYYYS
jgi:hypothetical protein